MNSKSLCPFLRKSQSGGAHTIFSAVVNDIPLCLMTYHPKVFDTIPSTRHIPHSSLLTVDPDPHVSLSLCDLGQLVIRDTSNISPYIHETTGWGLADGFFRTSCHL